MTEDTRKIRQALEEATIYWLEKASRLLGQSFEPPLLRFDLRGQAAGQYRSHPRPCIRYNLDLAALQFDAFLARTPGHEVAHYVIDQRFPNQRLRPHGPEWRDLMHGLGLDASRCHEFSLEGVPTRRQRRHAYRCACREHELSSTRHNRVLRGQAEYRCRSCGKVLVSSE
ncbi:SprT family zinc-dependent metalloprotease [Thiolapillus brandeum]|uniref:SprT protein n=1 Tax=Thiolapillus brandeum TaxID=1076588 RepID=A0A7U6GJ58_9GAMM|nr:SprT-like domain-containing protein [Thiolapillus brandeum]BAO44656.1 SprT protein [Thiolapillus brandeum]